MTVHNKDLPNAMIKSVSKISSIWLIPLVALAIGSWMILDTWQQQGPLITIEFSTAQGININETLVKLRDMPIGKVVDVKLNNALNGIIITARLDKKASALLTSDSQFWVVKPRISFGNISGLSTILSGAYIELSPGSDLTLASSFKGHENPPLTPFGTPGLHVTLDSNSDHAFDIGDPVLYRGNKVGRIEYVHFNSDKGKLYYNVFIDAPYDELITTNTRFWEVKGIEVDISAEGVKFNTGTLETLLSGGVAFDVPSYLSKGEVITERAYFSIYPNKEKVNERLYNVGQNYMVLFSQTIRGLKPGAVVEYKGIKIGEVVRTDIDYPEVNDFLSKQTLLPVMIKITPGRLGLQDNEMGVYKSHQDMKKWISQGLHAVLNIDNLLTGNMYIELKYHNIVHNEAKTYGDLLLIPTADSELKQLFTRISNIVNTLDDLPFKNVLDSANMALNTMSNAMKNFDSASVEVATLLKDPQSQTLIAQLNQTLISVEHLTRSYTDGSKTNQQLNYLLQTIEHTVKALTPLLIQLKMQPNSLIFSGEKRLEQEPTGQVQ
ncbi:MAG: paraquat-inducible protein B [Alteromonadaceae bacterium]|jgi:paraquat-inducible protein B